MKKVFALVLTLSMLLVLCTSCGNTSNVENTEDPPASEGQDDKGVLKLGSTWSKKDDDLFNDMYNKFVERLEEEALARGYSDLEVIDIVSGSNVQQQASDIEDMITQEVDIILCYPYDKDAIKTSIDAARDAGIIFVTYDRDVEEGGTQPDLWVGTDSYAQAYSTATLMFEEMERQGIEPNYIIEVTGEMNDLNVINRMNGYRDAAAEYGWEIAQQVTTDWSTESAQEGFAAAYTAHPETNCVLLHSDYFATAMQNVLEPAGRWVPEGEEGHVWMVGTDGWPNALTPIKEGYIFCSAPYDTVAMANEAVPVIMDMLEGTTETDQALKIAINPDVITSENIDSVDLWSK